MSDTNSETGKRNNFKERSVWGKIRGVFLFGIIGYLIAFSTSVGSKYFRGEAFSILEDALYSTTFFLIVAYWRIIELEGCRQTILRVLSPKWRKATKAFPLWRYAFIIWAVLAFASLQLLPHFPEAISLFQTVLESFLYILLFSLCFLSLIAYVPSGKFLSVLQIQIEEKRKVAYALTLVTPVLGFPWLLATSLVLSIANFPVEPYWIIYIVFIFIYVALYVFFVDLPYCVSIRETKRQKLDELEQRREGLLERLKSMNKDTQKSLLRKIAFESEVARIEREKQEVKSQSIHPYKVVIPLASFFLGVFGAIFIEFIKTLLQIA